MKSISEWMKNRLGQIDLRLGEYLISICKEKEKFGYIILYNEIKNNNWNNYFHF